MGEETTHYLGLVVALPRGNPLVCLSLDYTPTVNDLADLLAGVMRRPITDSPHRPRQLLLRENPLWEELFAHLKQLGIEVSIQDDLPRLEDVYEDFLLQMRRARASVNQSPELRHVCCRAWIHLRRAEPVAMLVEVAS